MIKKRDNSPQSRENMPEGLLDYPKPLRSKTIAQEEEFSFHYPEELKSLGEINELQVLRNARVRPGTSIVELREEFKLGPSSSKENTSKIVPLPKTAEKKEPKKKSEAIEFANTLFKYQLLLETLGSLQDEDKYDAITLYI